MREPIVQTVTGVKQVGKTYQTIHAIYRYLLKGRKVLVFDINKEYVNSAIQDAGLNFTIPTIDYKMVPEFATQQRAEARRIIPVLPNGREMSLKQKADMLGLMLEHFKGGLVVVEDINKYIINVANHVNVIDKIVSNRHRGQDIILQYQSLAALDPRIWQNTAVIRMHYQADDVDRYELRIPTFELVKIAQLLVNQQYFGGNKRFYCYIDQLDRKISGDFTAEDFIRACITYLESSTKLNAEMRRAGHKDRNVAKASVMRTLFQYYGN